MEIAYRLRPHLTVAPVDDTRVFLVGERERFLLVGAAYPPVLGALGRGSTASELMARLADRVSPPEVVFALQRLEQGGYIEPVCDEAASDAAWRALGAAPPALRVAVRGLDADAAPLEMALAACGLAPSRDGEVDIVLAVVADPLAPEVTAIGEATGRWAWLRLGGRLPMLSPIFGGDGPCDVCLEHRLRWNRPVECFIERRTGVWPRPAPLGSPGLDRVAAHLFAFELARWAAGLAPRLDHHALVFDPRSGTVEPHRVVRRPQCGRCGDSTMFARRAERPVEIAAVGIAAVAFAHADDGGHRTLPPEATYAALAHQVSPITGLVSSLGPIPRRDHPMRPVFGASYLVCPRVDVPDFDDFHRASMGKGRAPAQARVSALCEAIERINTFFQGDEPRRRACIDELGDTAIEPNVLQNFSRAQHQGRGAHNAALSDSRRAVPPPFDPQIAIDWTPVWSLTHRRRRYVPTTFCFTHVPTPPESRFCLHNPNGHAAGNTVEEAILQGFLELVERDGVALWWYNRAPRPAVDLTALDSTWSADLVAHYDAIGWQVWVLDVTTDLGVPTFVALGRDRRDGRFCCGFGAHLDATLGAERALTEFNQLFDPIRERPAPWDAGAVASLDFLLPAGEGPPPASIHPIDLGDAITTCVDRAAAAGLETLVLDYTRPDVALATVKVIAPGLRHFWPRLGPGRLYDVPARLGWIPRVHAEAELNPVALFL